MCEKVKEQLKPFLWHYLEASWQSNIFHKFKADVPQSTLVVLIDYAENIGLEANFEIMSEHWGHRQITLLSCVVFFRGDAGDVVQHVHAFWSDDLTHDCVFSHEGIRRIVSHYGTDRFSNLVVWSNGCKAQFKYCDYFYPFHAYRAQFNIRTVILNYFATAHGKNLADGVAAVFRSIIAEMLLTRDGIARLCDADTICQFMREHQAVPRKFSHVWASKCDSVTQRHYVHHLVTLRDLEVARARRAIRETVPGTAALHQLVINGLSTTVTHRELSCLCNECLAGRSVLCPVTAMLPKFVSHTMTEANTAARRVARCIQQDVLSLDTISNGEYIAVRVEDASEGYKLVRVVDSWRRLFEHRTDSVGTQHSRGSMVLLGQILEQEQRRGGLVVYTLSRTTMFVKRDWVACRRVRLTLRDVHSARGVHEWSLPERELERIHQHVRT